MGGWLVEGCFFVRAIFLMRAQQSSPITALKARLIQNFPKIINRF